MSKIYPLHALTTREANDTAIALMYAWATVADVLTFYQERIANEGYLRTATERRSILELARLIGYALRPGVASTVYLAYTLDEDKSVTPPKPTAATIPAGARAQSVPGPGELPQSFETSDDLEARSQWNTLQVRVAQPQTKPSILEGKDQDSPGPRVYLKGINTNLKQNDPLLIDFGKGKPELFRITDVMPDVAAERTLVTMQVWDLQAVADSFVADVREIVARYRAAVRKLKLGESDLVKRVNTRLGEVRTRPTARHPVSDLAKQIEEVTLAGVIKEIREIGAEPRSEEITPLMHDLMTGLEQAARDFSMRARPPATAIPFPTLVISAAQVFKPLLTPASVPPSSSVQLPRDVTSAFAPKADTNVRLLGGLRPGLRDTLPTALANAPVTAASGIKVYALRVKASLFGNSAPKKVLQIEKDTGRILKMGEWPIVEIGDRKDVVKHEEETTIYLDGSYDKILPEDWVVVDAGPVDSSKFVNFERALPLLITKIKNVQSALSRAEYGFSGKTTQIDLADAWLKFKSDTDISNANTQEQAESEFPIIRRTAVYAQSEELPLAEEPIVADICGGTDEPIELNGLYSDLQSGRWLILSGERTDIKHDTGAVVPGVHASELLMLAGVTQDVKKIPVESTNTLELPGDRIHTFIRMAEALSYCYKRDTVTIYGNVVKATHGETRNEVLGGGDGSKALQQFTLKQPPLTFVSAANPSGVDSTLQARVNDVLWHEIDSLAGLSPTDRKFITRTDDEGKTTVIFGNGREGARLPTGQENVKAVYRNGIGKPGNVKAGQITLLATRPLGVKEVTNPLRASGGADKENRDQARQNAPLAVMALDRLVSTQDYADFARTFAGIGKARAVRLSDGRRQLVHVTVAGADDIPIEKSSDLYRNLVKALRDFGDPYLPIQVDVRELLALVIGATVRVLPDYLWEKVEPKIRAVLLDRFSFDRRYLGQDAFLSEALSAIQTVEGVAYVDVDTFDTVDEDKIIDQLAGEAVLDLDRRERIPIESARVDDSQADPAARVRPAQLVYFKSDVPDTLILNEVTR